MSKELGTAPVLTDADYRNLNTGLRHIEVTMESLNKADAAGLDVSTEKAQLEGARETIESIKRHFFPNRP